MVNMVIHTNTWSWGESVLLVGFDGLGVVELYFEKKEPYVAYISGLSVVEPVRRKGYATILIQEAENICRERNVFRIDLRSVKEPFVMDFYHKLGFVDIEEEEGLMRMYKMLR